MQLVHCSLLIVICRFYKFKLKKISNKDVTIVIGRYEKLFITYDKNWLGIGNDIERNIGISIQKKKKCLYVSVIPT